MKHPHIPALCRIAGHRVVAPHDAFVRNIARCCSRSRCEWLELLNGAPAWLRKVDRGDGMVSLEVHYDPGLA